MYPTPPFLIPSSTSQNPVFLDVCNLETATYPTKPVLYPFFGLILGGIAGGTLQILRESERIFFYWGHDDARRTPSTQEVKSVNSICTKVLKATARNAIIGYGIGFLHALKA